jgi:hypothetical protein
MATSRWRRNYTPDGKRADGWNTGDKVETQDVMYVTLKEKVILLAAMQAYRLLPHNREDKDVQALCERLEVTSGFKPRPN